MCQERREVCHSECIQCAVERLASTCREVARECASVRNARDSSCLNSISSNFCWAAGLYATMRARSAQHISPAYRLSSVTVCMTVIYLYLWRDNSRCSRAPALVCGDGTVLTVRENKTSLSGFYVRAMHAYHVMNSTQLLHLTRQQRLQQQQPHEPAASCYSRGCLCVTAGSHLVRLGKRANERCVPQA
jgi:hypothetical protein